MVVSDVGLSPSPSPNLSVKKKLIQDRQGLKRNTNTKFRVEITIEDTIVQSGTNSKLGILEEQKIHHSNDLGQHLSQSAAQNKSPLTTRNN